MPQPRNVIDHKRGRTWRETITVRDVAGALVDLSGWAVTSQLRRRAEADTIVQTFTCTVHPDQVTHRGELEVYASSAASAAWPLDLLAWDIRLVDAGGDVDITETIGVHVQESVTR